MPLWENSMSVYMTETEQLEEIKKWWKRYGNYITVPLSILLLVISGYKYWIWHEEKVTQQASNSYEQLMAAFSTQDTKAVRAYAKVLITDYSQTIYADVARLTLAKLYVAHEKYPKAETELAYVANHSKQPVLVQIAKIRLARILAANKSYDDALKQISSMSSDLYLPVANELRADIYAEKGQYQEALALYRQAINDVQKNGMGNLFLEMKTNELAAMTQSMNTSKDTAKTA